MSDIITKLKKVLDESENQMSSLISIALIFDVLELVEQLEKDRNRWWNESLINLQQAHDWEARYNDLHILLSRVKANTDPDVL